MINMKRVLFLLILIPQILYGQNALNMIQSDLESGQISHEEYLVNRALAIYEPAKLAEVYRDAALSEKPLKSGTMIAADLKRHWNLLSTSDQNLLADYLTRPALPYSVISPSGQFKIHYTLSGNQAVSATDVNPENGIPDYVDRVAESFDYVHYFETEVLGFAPPPTDLGNGGGDEFDVYIRDFTRIYGQTFFEGKVPGQENSYYGYTEIDNDYFGFSTSGLDGMRVTSAHEYFHAIHFGYKFKPNDDVFWEDEVFYYEISSTWMEEIVYDDVNDYHFYLRSFFRNIDMPFDTYDGSYEYGNCLFNHMLSKKYGNDIIVRVWEHMRSMPAIEAIDAALSEFGSNFDDAHLEYATWNYFTGSRADTVNYYRESDEYPEVTYKRIVDFTEDTSFLGTMNQFSYAYYQVINSETENGTVFMPVNREDNEGTTSSFTLELSRFTGQLFTEIEEGFNVRMTVDQLTRWDLLYINETGNTGEYTVQRINPVDPSVLKMKDLIVGLGPNPFMPDSHDGFSLFYQLKEKSPVTITIMDENGIEIRKFQFPVKHTGLNSFHWENSEYGQFPGGSGIYLIMIKADDKFDTTKLAVIR